MSARPDEPALSLAERDGVTLVRLRHTPVLDTTAVQTIGRELYELVDGGQKLPLVLDLSEVRFIASQGLGLLLTMRRKADKATTRLALAGVQPELMRVLRITGLDKLLPAFTSTDEAIASLQRA
ncbi:MAG: STAS domain-containing protein [Phycisphaerae bacterium]|jgi:anti-anti-sigma factor|nr:STAS domain-containing protein [Phycisphaerae bacterium]MCZ2400484.1 STAS domain-containing protein [Phycisphaerae bacterium]NUQ49604.1 STAS domain-containing protein [Phycisphaerae bacterium]